MISTDKLKVKKRWVNREHLFTPENITKYEFAMARESRAAICRKCKMNQPKPLPNGPVLFIVKNGFKDFIKRADDPFWPFLSEDRTGEPDQFHLED